jgi:hypothetical protein
MSDPILEAIHEERLLINAGAKSRRPVGPLFAELHERMGAALAYGLGGPASGVDVDALRFVGSPLGAMLETLLRARGIGWNSRAEMFSRGITTGDVPALLEGAGNRLLRQGYESYTSGLLRLCARVRSRDFRDVRAIQIDGDLALQEVNEGAFAEGNLSASADTFKVSTFGRVIGLSQNLFTDDDLDAFGNLSSRLGTAAAEFVSGKIAEVLESNPTLSDGVPAFHATHGNLGTPGTLSETTVGELLKLLRAKKGLGGQSIAVEPGALVVPSALELAARKIVAAITPGNSTPPFLVVVEPRLTSPSAYYLLAAPSVAAISYTYPAGAEGPTIEVGARFEFRGVQARVKLDFGAGWSDHRGAVKNAG